MGLALRTQVCRGRNIYWYQRGKVVLHVLYSTNQKGQHTCLVMIQDQSDVLCSVVPRTLLSGGKTLKFFLEFLFLFVGQCPNDISNLELLVWAEF